MKSASPPLYYLTFFFETRSHVAQADLELLILLPPPPECWDYSVPPCRALFFETESYHVSQAVLELMILLPQFLKCWEHRGEAPVTLLDVFSLLLQKEEVWTAGAPERKSDCHPLSQLDCE